MTTISQNWLLACTVTVHLCDLRQHSKTCALSPAVLHTPVRATTTASLVGDVLLASPSKTCGDVADRLMIPITLSKTSEARLEIKTTSRGRPQVFHRIMLAASTSFQAAKLFNNAVRPLILPIEAGDTVIPALHLDMCIFSWLYDHMEKEVQQLHRHLALQCASSNEDDDRFTQLTAIYVKNSSHYVSSCRTQSRSIPLLRTNCNSLHFGESSIILAKMLGTNLLRSFESCCEPSPDMWICYDEMNRILYT